MRQSIQQSIGVQTDEQKSTYSANVFIQTEKSTLSSNATCQTDEVYVSITPDIDRVSNKVENLLKKSISAQELFIQDKKNDNQYDRYITGGDDEIESVNSNGSLKGHLHLFEGETSMCGSLSDVIEETVLPRKRKQREASRGKVNNIEDLRIISELNYSRNLM
jgi:hypothetical protein